MLPVSIIILTKNEERNIVRCVASLNSLTNDIQVTDSGSTDQTIQLATDMGAQVRSVQWEGYAKTKTKANACSKFDWVLSLDADEEISAELRGSLRTLFSKTPAENTAYRIKRKLVYCGKVLHFGSVGHEYRLRLFNKKNACWNEQAVHEDIAFNTGVNIRKLQGVLWHYSYYSIEEHQVRTEHYARLFAQQKIALGIRYPFYKKYVSALFGFIKNYLFRLGLLDGYKGLQFALIEMKYTYQKYALITA
ncbi:MAG: glycosyltransferase family 2 protein [Chitinophagaceae bacterium]|nr:glycosyltransferase family 2 protein [Chitinophagaceae bacterium]